MLVRTATDPVSYGNGYQWAAWKAIESLGPAASSAVPTILDLIRREPQYTYEALKILKAIGPGAAQAVDDLIMTVQRRGSTYSGGGSCRSRACEVLGSIGPPAANALPVLRWAAHDPSSETRRAAREAIAAVTASWRGQGPTGSP
jgi:hypothetical protein